MDLYDFVIRYLQYIPKDMLVLVNIRPIAGANILKQYLCLSTFEIQKTFYFIRMRDIKKPYSMIQS